MTDRCVQRFDHFCQFTNAPVGASNHHFFLVTLALTVATFCQFIALFWPRLPPLLPLPAFIQANPLLVFQYAQSVVFATLMGYLLCAQLWYAATGYTTNEKIGQQSQKYAFLWRHGQPYSPFSRGSYVANLADFFLHIDRYHRVFHFPSELPVSVTVDA